MWRGLDCTAFIFVILLAVALSDSSREQDVDRNQEAEGSSREGRLFSLFNIVQFRNDPCTSTMSGNRGRRNGVCYTSSQCEARNGSPQGTCAAGFGVCCVFVRSASASVIRENCSYIVNEVDEEGDFEYTVIKRNTNVCSLRLDFEEFSITVDDSEMDSCTTDSFSVSVPDNAQVLPVICGENSGQHMYIDLGDSDRANLRFALTGEERRQWEIKVTQVTCGNQPPTGCLQYLTGITGQIKTFNYDNTNVQVHLSDQMYSICIRPRAGLNCIEYSVCEEDSFDLNRDDESDGMTTLTDTDCNDKDYIGISASSNNCDNTEENLVNKYCGDILNNENGGNVPICVRDESLFIVNIFTNNIVEPEGDEDAESTKGVCLNYKQLSC